MLSRTLSFRKVLWPINTASPSERCRIKCFLSVREVKSTGQKVRDVIFPSTVMANVAITNGRCRRRPLGDAMREVLVTSGPRFAERNIYSRLVQFRVRRWTFRLRRGYGGQVDVRRL